VQRFGAAVADLEPGLYWRWPWPIEQTQRVTRQVRRVEIGFRAAAAKKSPKQLAWSSTHRDRVENEAVMITGDRSLLDLQATVRYRVTDPRVFLFAVQDPDEIVRGAAEAALRGLVATRAFEDLLTHGRAALQAEALARLRERCTNYSERGLGILFDGVDLHDLHPPPEVVQSYYDVTIAKERYNRAINDAKARATEQERGASAKVLVITREGTVARTKKKLQAERDRDVFRAWSEARRTIPLSVEIQHAAWSALGYLGGNEDAKVAVARWEVGRAALVRAYATLIDFRLYTETFTRALAGRDLTLIDAEKVRVQGNLWFFETDPFRFMIPPFLGPGARGQPRPDEGP